MNDNDKKKRKKNNNLRGQGDEESVNILELRMRTTIADYVGCRINKIFRLHRMLD